jgi:SAM-dependent methyltransferase
MNAQLRRNLDHFGDWANEEQEHLRLAASRNDLIQRVLLELRPNNGTFADVGCFTGAATAQFKSLGFRHAVGFDASEVALTKAAQRGIETRRWLIGEERCPADDGEFDVVLASEIIEHLVDTDGFLEELRRILHGEGCLIVTTPNLAFWVSRLRLLQGRIPWNYPGASATVRLDNAVDLAHIRVTTLGEWAALFRSHRFTVNKMRGWSILRALHGRPLIRFIDGWMTRFPTLAFGLLFVLEKA